MSPLKNFIVATPGRSVCDDHARVLSMVGALRFIALATRRGTNGVPSEQTRLNPALGLAFYMAVKTSSNFSGESFRFSQHPRFDRWVLGMMNPGDNVISSYGYANECFRFARNNGGVTFLDGGNSHPQNFWDILVEEHKTWKCPYPPIAGHHFERALSMMDDVDYILAPSQFVAKSFVDRGFLPSQILPNIYPVNLVNFTPAEMPRPANRPLTLICTGSLSLRKGTPYLLEAFRIIRRSVPNCRLLLTKAIADSVKPVIERNLDLPIEWSPGLNHQLLATRLRSADIYVLPSLEEGLARTFTEALACGLPAILTPNTGCEGIIEEGVNGSIVPVRDPEAIAAKVLWWWEKIQSEPARIPVPLLDVGRFSFAAFAHTFSAQVQPFLRQDSPNQLNPPSKTIDSPKIRRLTTDRRKTLLFVVGAGRSGTTLLGSLLNSAPNAFCLGELHTILWNGYHGDVCSCRKDLFECSFWRGIFAKTGYEWSEEFFTEWNPRLQKIIRYKNLHQLLRGSRASFPTDPMLRQYLDMSEGIYGAVAEETGADVLIDVSKHPMVALAMSAGHKHRLMCLHLIRDPRGVAYSWTKIKRTKSNEPSLQDVMMKPIGKLRALTSWNVENILSELTRLSSHGYMRMRYEDLVSDPVASLSEICEWSGIAPIHPVEPGTKKFLREPGHMMAGNLNRFEGKVVTIKSDEQWRQDLSAADRLLVDTLTYFTKKRYRY